MIAFEFATTTPKIHGTLMRDQYAGNTADLLKFAFLRALAGSDRKLGVAWYYVPSTDGTAAGMHFEWADEPAWRVLDPVLCDGLVGLTERTVAALEQAPIWPNETQFFREPLPGVADRVAWATQMRTALDGTSIAFLDPDSGIGEPSKKHATFSEIQLLRKPGRAVGFVSFPGRSATHDAQVKRLHKRLIDEAGATNVTTLRVSVSFPHKKNSRLSAPRQIWLTVVDADTDLIARANAYSKAVGFVPRTSVRLNFTTAS